MPSAAEAMGSVLSVRPTHREGVQADAAATIIDEYRKHRPFLLQRAMSSHSCKRMSGAKRAGVLGTVLATAGCDMVVMNPSGDIARQQADLIVTSTALMLLVIVPVIVLTLWFAWRYRASNRAAAYAPDWDHSTKLELVIWGAPLMIIIALGALTWISTHKLDPFRPLERIDAGRPLPPGIETLEVQVVAMDWKWLFVYPQYGIATVNELAAPVDRPIRFSLTASSVMNAFYVPALAGMIYAMPGMESKLHAVINRAGVYDGLSANFSGDGFSHMRFKFHGLSPAQFESWLARHKARPEMLDRAAYLALERPSAREPVRGWGSVEEGLFDAAVNRCVDRNRMCVSRMMAIDSGSDGRRSPLEGSVVRERRGDGWSRYVAADAVCTRDGAGIGVATAQLVDTPAEAWVGVQSAR
jgi:cytochrome o ubiquinol oxidase subunit 2